MVEMINEKYNEVISSLAERAKMIITENDESFTLEDGTRQAIDDGFFYGEDEAIVLAHSYINGLVKWGEEVDWDRIYEDMFEDIMRI